MYDTTLLMLFLFYHLNERFVIVKNVFVVIKNNSTPILIPICELSICNQK